MVFEVNGNNEANATHAYFGRNATVSSYIEHWTYDQEANKLAATAGHDSLVLRNEQVIGMLEYDPNKMVLATHDNRLLLFHDFNIVRTYDGPDLFTACQRKGSHLECLPGFDNKSGDLLFIVWSLEDAVYLVNLNNTSIFPFVQREISTFDTCGQQPFFFRREPHGESMYFTGTGEIDHEQVYHSCYKMQLRQEFF